MRDFQQKTPKLSFIKRLTQSKFVLTLLSILIFFFAWNLFTFMEKMQKTTKHRKIMENKIVELKKKKERLTGNIEKLKTDRGIEEELRNKLGLGKEGEEVIIILGEKK